MIQVPNRDSAITDLNGVPMSIFFGWMLSISKAIDLLNPIDGTGSPEGVVKAPQKSYFFDTVGEELYFKTTNETLDTGWVQLT